MGMPHGEHAPKLPRQTFPGNRFALTRTKTRGVTPQRRRAGCSIVFRVASLLEHVVGVARCRACRYGLSP
jgi:hypothetical protein